VSESATADDGAREFDSDREAFEYLADEFEGEPVGAIAEALLHSSEGSAS